MNGTYNFQIRVTGILISDGELLIVRQKLSERRAWSLPGGRLEHGETLEQGIVREMLEETGLNVAVERLLYVCDVEPDCRVLHITFLLSKLGGELTLSDNSHDENPISDVWFVPLSELCDYGFSERFAELAIMGFPNSGGYMRDKTNIGLRL